MTEWNADDWSSWWWSWSASGQHDWQGQDNSGHNAATEESPDSQPTEGQPTPPEGQPTPPEGQQTEAQGQQTEVQGEETEVAVAECEVQQTQEGQAPEANQQPQSVTQPQRQQDDDERLEREHFRESMAAPGPTRRRSRRRTGTQSQDWSGWNWGQQRQSDQAASDARGSSWQGHGQRHTARSRIMTDGLSQRQCGTRTMSNGLQLNQSQAAMARATS